MVRPAVDAGSFRDPAGFIFWRGGQPYRQLNRICQADYEQLIGSGLYDQLVSDGLLIPHVESRVAPAVRANSFKVIKPTRIPLVSYPYEWSFSQLKDAALVTLAIQRRALESGLTLQDASAYNVQFLDGRPIFIDTLSFERHRSGTPWAAYRQFCQHFLAPLALMSEVDLNLFRLQRDYLDGIPLELASRLLPARSRFRFSLLTHIHLQNRSQRSMAQRSSAERRVRVSDRSLVNLLTSLEGGVRALKLPRQKTGWGDYDTDHSYGKQAFAQKRTAVIRLIRAAKPKTVWDVGGNDGQFSRLAADQGALVASLDVDPLAVEKNYRIVKARKETNLLPLIADLLNPSPGLGWGGGERKSLLDRSQPDLVMALALVHHLALRHNLPLPEIAANFRSLAARLIIEFVPKEDPRSQDLLALREDIFPNYDERHFREAFTRQYRLRQRIPLRGSKRVLYYFAAK